MANGYGTLGDLAGDTRIYPVESDARALPVPDPNMQHTLPVPIYPTDPSGGPKMNPGGWQNPAFGANYNPNAPRLVGNTLYEHGNQRVLQPDEIAGAQAYVTDHFNQFGANQGNVWGTGHANDPYHGQIPFPQGVTPDPALLDKFYPGGAQAYQSTATFNPQYGHMGPTGAMPGNASGYGNPWSAAGGAAGGMLNPGGMGSAAGAAFGMGWPNGMGSAVGGAFGMGGRRNNPGRVRNNRGGGTLADLAGSGSSYEPPLVP